MIPSFALATLMAMLPTNTAVPLLKNSKNQPVLAAVAGKNVYFAEGVALDEPASGCPGRDLYRATLADRKEERLASYPCVSQVHAAGDAVYVVYRAEGDAARRVARWKDDAEDTTVGERIEKAKARFLWKRLTEKLPRRPAPALVGLATQGATVWAVFHTTGDRLGLWAEPIAYAGAKCPDAIVLPAENEAPEEVAVTGDGRWFALRRTTAGVELVRLDTSTNTVVALGRGTKPLPKTWSNADEERWFARRPRHLVGGVTNLFFADRTDAIFTESSAVAFYEPGKKSFVRLSAIPGEDVSGLQLLGSGVVVAKPMDGSVIWYGPTDSVPEAISAAIPQPKPAASPSKGPKP